MLNKLRDLFIEALLFDVDDALSLINRWNDAVEQVQKMLTANITVQKWFCPRTQFILRISCRNFQGTISHLNTNSFD